MTSGFYHGLCNHKLYGTWVGQRQRCNDKNAKAYQSYGGRGISISKEFDDFKIWVDYIESLENCYKENYTVDRIDNDGNYERGNLRWCSIAIQNTNRRKLKTNTSGFTGVFKYKDKWRAMLSIKNKLVHIGLYKTIAEAVSGRDTYIIKNNLPHKLSSLYTRIAL